MDDKTSFYDAIVSNMASNAIWAIFGVGIVYSIYCRFRLQALIRNSLKKQPEYLSALQNAYLATVKLNCLDLNTYFKDGIHINLPSFLEEDDILHFGKFSRWTLLKDTSEAFKVLSFVLKRYESKRSSISGMPSRDQARELLCLGMNIYYQMIVISKDWKSYTMPKNPVDEFTDTLAKYFGAIVEDAEALEFFKADYRAEKSIELAPDLR